MTTTTRTSAATAASVAARVRGRLDRMAAELTDKGFVVIAPEDVAETARRFALTSEARKIQLARPVPAGTCPEYVDGRAGVEPCGMQLTDSGECDYHGHVTRPSAGDVTRSQSLLEAVELAQDIHADRVADAHS